MTSVIAFDHIELEIERAAIIQGFRPSVSSISLATPEIIIPPERASEYPFRRSSGHSH